MSEEKTQITIEQLRPYSIFLATPMYGGQCTGSYAKSVVDLSMLCAVNGIKIKHYFLFNESLIQRARNYCVDEFMRSDCTHLLFVDADISFNPRDALSMLGLQINDPERYDIISAPYPKKTIAWEKVKNAVDQGRGNENPFELDQFTGDYAFNPIDRSAGVPLNQPIQVGEAATGFMLIPKYVLEKYAEAYPELKYKPDHARTAHFDGTNEITAFFDCCIDPETKRYLSEDYFFSQQARKAGLSVWMCPWMNLNHTGTYVFKGNLAAIASLPGTAATATEKSNRKYYNKAKETEPPFEKKNTLRNQKKRNRKK